MYAPSNDAVQESIAGVHSVLANERISLPERLNLEFSRPTLQLIKSGLSGGKSGDKGTRRNACQISQCRQSREESVLTVDAFLKSSTKGKPAKTYRHRELLSRRDSDPKANPDTQRVLRSSRRDSLRRASSSNDGDGDKRLLSNHERNSKNSRRRKNRRPLKQRLYEAAILTHGQPDDYYTRSEADMASNRVALLFVPDELDLRGRDGTEKTHTKALLVDPRKSMAMQKASLACGKLRGYTVSGQLSNTLDRIPLSKWNLSSNDGQHAKSAPTKRKKAKTTGDMAIMDFDYPPLSFVAFQEAEKNYKAMFPGVGYVSYFACRPCFSLMCLVVNSNGLFMKPDTLAKITSSHEGAIHTMDKHDWSLSLFRERRVICIDDSSKCLVQVNLGGSHLKN